MEPFPEELFPVEPGPLLSHPYPHLRLYLGTASWTFPGWGGLVYSCRETTERLARAGLAAYARHPLFNAVALDRTYYAPLATRRYKQYASEVPDNFRFLVKAPAELVSPDSPFYLDPDRARQVLEEPAREGLGDKLLLLHFLVVGPQPPDFVPRLKEMLMTLSVGTALSVEVRRPSLLTSAYTQALSQSDASHTWNIIRPMPLEQPEIGPVRLVRWHLGSAPDLRQAARRLLPFDRIQDPQPEIRHWLAGKVRRWLEEGETVVVLVNNKAEGCAPRTLHALAAELRGGQR